MNGSWQSMAFTAIWTVSVLGTLLTLTRWATERPQRFRYCEITLTLSCAALSALQGIGMLIVAQTEGVEVLQASVATVAWSEVLLALITVSAITTYVRISRRPKGDPQ